MLIDPSGAPLKLPAKPESQPQPRRVRAGLSGSAPSVFPYDAANWTTPEMGNWLPWIRSPDAEINQFRDRMVARTRDLHRNDCWASGAISRILDSTIGGNYRLLAKPDYRALSVYDKAFDEEWADEFRLAAESIWRNYANDLGLYNDLTRQQTVSQQFRLGFGHKLIDGENLTVRYSMPERIGYGAARYATTYLVVDPDRLSNPYQMVDSEFMRGGVEIDRYGVPVAYHIRKAHQNDWYNAIQSMEWERVKREDEDGWQRVIHDFDRGRAGQNRGVSVFAPVISRLKMLASYYGIELQAATVAATFGTYIESPYDPKLVEQAIVGGDGDAELSMYQQLRAEWGNAHPAMLNQVRIPTLAPGEKINAVAGAHPHSQFSPFTHEMLRGVAACLGTSAEQVTQDYSEASWSSARAGIVEAEKMFVRRLSDFNAGTATPTYAGILEEAMENGELPLPGNAPDFAEARTAYSAGRWLGAARGWVDPVAERQGVLRLAKGRPVHIGQGRSGQYGVIYCDPPWSYEMYSDKGYEKSPDAHYDCMSMTELKALRDPIIFATAPNAVCIMWACFAMLPQALDLMEAWGFQYKTGGPWVKRAGNGNPAMGTGYVLRSAAELFLIGTHGAPLIKNRSTRNLLLTGEWPTRPSDIDAIIVDTLRREHSRKPDEMGPLIENLFDGPYLELFARTQRPGWDIWGNETGKFIEPAPEVTQPIP
jgi:lambda family phage portal protein